MGGGGMKLLLIHSLTDTHILKCLIPACLLCYAVRQAYILSFLFISGIYHLQRSVLFNWSFQVGRSLKLTALYLQLFILPSKFP